MRRLRLLPCASPNDFGGLGISDNPVTARTHSAFWLEPSLN